MAAYAALVSLMNNIEQIMNHHRLSTSFDNHQIQHLLEKATSLLHFIEANNYVGARKEAKDLEREIASAAHAAEDVIESHAVDQSRKKSFMEAVMKLFLELCAKKQNHCLPELQQKIQDMDAVLNKANEFKWSQGSGEEPPTPVMEIGETAMVGLDAELEQLLHELTFEHPSNLHAISIVGMGGTGKTTLAKNIYENKLIKHHFDLRAWASISQQHNAQDTLSQLLRGLGESSNNDLGLHLHQSLSGRRYLIILDDIWSAKAWDEVRRFFPDNNNGSRIVLTTRLLNVATDCGSSPFIMKFLDKYNSRKLFCEVAFKNERCPPELERVSEEIVMLCKGLALSIVVMGGLLFKSPKTVEYWKGVVKDIKSSVLDSKEKQESLDVLSLSYTHLPPHLKPCFLYMGVFQEDAKIRVSNVVRLWVAEGFIKPNGSQVLEEIGEGYLKDLIDRNLILAGERRKNGKIGTCGIHDLLRDLCIKEAEQQRFFRVIASENNSIEDSRRRVVCRFYSNNIKSILTWNIVMRVKNPELIRVLVQQERDDSAEEFYSYLNLRYLSHHTRLRTWWKLPSSTYLVWNLQTLIFNGTFSSEEVVATTEFWKMRQLRHVKCHKIYLPQCNRRDMLIFENMQTLKTALNFNLSEEVCKSIPNVKKLGLEYDSELRGYYYYLLKNLCNLGRLDKLESLKLKFLCGTPYLNEKLRFPSSLNKLWLGYYKLEWEDVSVMLGSLPQLQVLTLVHGSSSGSEWSPVVGQFRQLKFLKIHNRWIEHWEADQFHFPVLEKLVLRDLSYLKEIPEGIGDIPTLKLIHVDEDCSMSAAISAVKIKEVQLDNGNDSLQIQVTVPKSNRMRFKKMVRSEGLSINKIVLKNAL